VPFLLKALHIQVTTDSTNNQNKPKSQLTEGRKDAKKQEMILSLIHQTIKLLKKFYYLT
jgi:hypothetical protein